MPQKNTPAGQRLKLLLEIYNNNSNGGPNRKYTLYNYSFITPLGVLHCQIYSYFAVAEDPKLLKKIINHVRHFVKKELIQELVGIIN